MHRIVVLPAKLADALRLFAIDVADMLPYRLFVEARRQAYRLAGARLGRGACVYGRQIVSHPQRLAIGDGCFINAACCFENEGGVTIGRRTYVGPRVNFLTTNHRAGMANETAPIRIGDDCWIGGAATLLPGCTLASGTVVAAGAVMLGRVHERGLYAGVPGALKRAGDPTEPSGGC
jgi:acetyltransferase-like isoleucine patch superfamily enzyme